MKVTDIPYTPLYTRIIFSMHDLLYRASGSGRATWIDLPTACGIYAVYVPNDVEVTFIPHITKAVFATPKNPAFLQQKWERITAHSTTDIIYIGTADNLRNRLSQLVRFGLGKARNHRGGEWMWQVHGIENTQVLVQTCPPGRQVAFENWLLEQFFIAHNDYPLANREGPEGNDRWKP